MSDLLAKLYPDHLRDAASSAPTRPLRVAVSIIC